MTDVMFFSSGVLALNRCTRNKEYKRLMCIKEVRNGELMLPHHVNSWTIPVDLGIVSRENAKIPKTGTLSSIPDHSCQSTYGISTTRLVFHTYLVYPVVHLRTIRLVFHVSLVYPVVHLSITRLVFQIKILMLSLIVWI